MPSIEGSGKSASWHLASWHLLGLGIFFFVSFPSFFLLSSLSHTPRHLDLLTSGIIYCFAEFEVDFT